MTTVEAALALVLAKFLSELLSFLFWALVICAFVYFVNFTD
ncbi:hypothetical protein [Leptolyngbya phage Lsp-JY17]